MFAVSVNPLQKIFAFPATIVASGAAGVINITVADIADVHPDVVVTVKLYEPTAKPVIVLLVPLPAIFPGLIVQVPVPGKPFKTTLPVGVMQVG